MPQIAPNHCLTPFPTASVLLVGVTLRTEVGMTGDDGEWEASVKSHPLAAKAGLEESEAAAQVLLLARENAMYVARCGPLRRGPRLSAR